jgi:hypothetical protein
VTDDNDTAERAKELLVYGPLGLAFFVRDSAPQFMRMFVARGRTELQQRSRSVGSQIDQVRSLGESVAADGGPEMLRVLSTGIAALREKAEEALQALGVNTPDAPPARSAPVEEALAAPSTELRGSSTGADLAIVGYDDLSASQIVDHLDGLPRADLEAIRVYEAAHRARNTILGKIEQLTRGS